PPTRPPAPHYSPTTTHPPPPLPLPPPATPQLSTLPLHDALPISRPVHHQHRAPVRPHVLPRSTPPAGSAHSRPIKMNHTDLAELPPATPLLSTIPCSGATASARSIHHQHRAPARPPTPPPSRPPH